MDPKRFDQQPPKDLFKSDYYTFDEIGSLCDMLIADGTLLYTELLVPIKLINACKEAWRKGWSFKAKRRNWELFIFEDRQEMAIYETLFCMPLEDMPLHINDTGVIQIAALWRLMIGK